MADRAEELTMCVDALRAVNLVRNTYASSVKSGALVREIADALATYRSNMGTYGGICQQVSDAIYRGFLNCEPEPPKT